MSDAMSPSAAQSMDPFSEEQDLVDSVRTALSNDPERLKRVARLLVDSEVENRAIQMKRVKRDVDVHETKRWALFKKRLQAVSSFGAAQGVVDSVPSGAAPSERSFYLHLGKFLQTRAIPEAANAEEREELGALLIRISESQKA